MNSRNLDELVEKLTDIYVTAQINRKPMGAGDFADLYLSSEKVIRDRLSAGE